MLRLFLQSILRFLSVAILRKYQPDIIAITGSVGKTSTREAVFQVLCQKFRVRRNEKNYNTEIGVPLTIIGSRQSPENSLGRWWLVLLKALRLIVVKSRKYPEILILELAADKPGDIKYFLSFLKPRVGIITTISEVHLENFVKFNQIIAEKRLVIESLPKEGWAVLNNDEERIRKMAKKTQARIITYGLRDQQVDIKAQEVKVILKNNQLGLYFKLIYQDTATPVFIPEVAADQQIYSLLAAAVCGVIYQLTNVEIAQGLEEFRCLPGRFVIRSGINNSWLIDDTYNAAPISTCAALGSLINLPIGQRKIAVLADMLELGRFEEKGHQEVGECVAKQGVDLLLTYGERARLIAQSASAAGLSKSRVRHYEDQKELIKYLRSQLKSGDVVLIKGSHGMKMEQVVGDLLLK